MSNDCGYIRLADKSDSNAIVQLRLKAYNNSKEFKLCQPEALDWSEADEEQAVLCAFNNTGELLSTTRGGIVRSLEEAESKLGITVHLNESSLPSLLLGRGATEKHVSKIGLHTALRYYFLKAMIAEEINSCIGLVYANAPRTNMMQELGYAFYSPDKVWDPEVIPIMPPLFAILERSKFAYACKHIENSLKNTLSSFSFIGRPIVLKKKFSILKPMN